MADRSPVEAREHGRLSALAGKPIWINPEIGDNAGHWFNGWHSVPEDERGSQPDIVRTPHARTSKKGQGVKARWARAVAGLEDGGGFSRMTKRGAGVRAAHNYYDMAI